MILERALRAALADKKLHLLSIFSVKVAFVCLAATLLIWVNIDSVKERLSESGRASVYLKRGVQLETIQALRKALQGTAGVSKVEYLTPEAARSMVLGDSQDEALSRLPEEAFPASLEVTVSETNAEQRLSDLKKQLSVLPSVETVEIYEIWGERFRELLSGGLTAALLLIGVVLLAVVSVVGSTMRMALSRRSREVEVLKMVGATDSYVRGPFVVEGAVQGALGALLAVVLLFTLYLILKDAFDGALGTLIGFSPRFLPWSLAMALVILGGSIGAMSSYLSLRRLIRSFA